MLQLLILKIIKHYLQSIYKEYLPRLGCSETFVFMQRHRIYLGGCNGHGIISQLGSA